MGVHCPLANQNPHLDCVALGHDENGLWYWVVQAIVLGASAAFGMRSLAALQTKVFEAVQVLAVSFRDAGEWHFVVGYDFVAAGIDFVGTEEGANRRMGHSGNSEAHSGIEVEPRFETAVDHSETD